MGNWDAWILDGVPALGGEVGPRLSAQGEWCASRLEPEDLEFLRGFRADARARPGRDARRPLPRVAALAHRAAPARRLARRARPRARGRPRRPLPRGPHAPADAPPPAGLALRQRGQRRPAVLRGARRAARCGSRAGPSTRARARSTSAASRSSSAVSPTTSTRCSRPRARAGCRTPTGGPSCWSVGEPPRTVSDSAASRARSISGSTKMNEPTVTAIARKTDVPSSTSRGGEPPDGASCISSGERMYSARMIAR